MAGDVIITIVGNLTSEPELKYLPNGKPVANFTIAHTPRFFDRQANDWKDGESLFMRCSLWGAAAENAVESFAKGTRVIAQGKLKQRSFESKGEKRTVIELEVEEIGPSIRSAVAKVNRTERGSAAAADPWSAKPAEADPWATPGPSTEPSF